MRKTFDLGWVIVGFLLLLGAKPGTAGTYTLTFDDAPRGDSYFTGAERTARLVGELKASGVERAVFYCNPRDCSAARCDRLMQYSQAGHGIANHTADHPDLDQVSAETFIQSIDSAHRALKGYPGFELWFRYPYLREGRFDPAKQAAVKAHLRKTGYRLGYVTVETADWHLESRLQQAFQAQKRVDFVKLKKVYLQVIRESVLFYDRLAMNTIGYSPVHVILLHENDLAAMFIKDVVNDLKLVGMKPVRAEAAFTDRIIDPVWDTTPSSMRRLNVIAEHRGYVGDTDPKWVHTSALDKLLDEERVFQSP